jgi:starch synthase
MYSLKYGTVPIVRAAGGLDDTIEGFDRTTLRGTGFKFAEYDPARLLEKIHEALTVYGEPDQWRALMLNGMRADFSWAASAGHYVELYRRLAGLEVSAAV